LSLLTLLVTSRGAVPRDTAAFALWPDEDEEAARANVRRNLNALRGALPEAVGAWIVSDGASIEFRHADADTDIAGFEGAASRPDGLAAAAEMYGGDFALPLDDPWVLTERERLRARFHAVLTELVGREFSARRFEDALKYARRIFADEPFREDIARRVISIRYAMGDRPGALAEFERFARSLRHEMNIDPMPETVGLRDLVLRGEALPFAPDAALRVRESPGRSGGPLLAFAGREVVLARLDAVWQAASNGDGTTVFVAGEAGIGKTRLVAEFLERSVGTSARVFRGTTASPEARPFEALLRAFGAAAPFVPALDIEPVWLAALAQLVPEIGARATRLPTLPALPSEREVTRLFEAFSRFAIALSRGRAVAIVLEDLHWSGSGTFEALRQLAMRLRGYRVLLLVTYRSGETSAVEPLADDLCAAGLATTVGLTRLRLGETLEMLARADPPLTGPEAAGIAARADGHPLFLAELLRDFREVSGTAPGGGIAELVKARLSRCSPDARILARIAAVCGSTFDLDLLGRVAGWDDGTLIDRLAELLARQFVRSTAFHERGSYAFSHALVHGAVVAGVEADERRRIHRIAARVLEIRQNAARHDVEIARHWLEAGEPQRAAEAYLRAVRTSLAAFAREEAANFATLGLASATSLETRSALLTGRIQANLRRAPAEVLRADALLLAQAVRELDEDTRFEAALLAMQIEEVAGEIGPRVKAADALRAFDCEGKPLRAGRISEADAKNAMQSGNFRHALTLAHEARRRFANAGSESDELRAVLLIAGAQSRLGLLHDALAALIEIESRVAARNDLALAIDYWFARTGVPHAQRDARANLEAAQRVSELARAAGDRLMEGHAALMSATAHQHASALSRALAEIAHADEIYLSIGAVVARRVSRNNFASTLLQIGRIDEAAHVLRALYAEGQAHTSIEKRYFAASNLGCALLAAGEVEEALRLQREALDLARAMSSDGFAALALGDLGSAEIAAGDPCAGLAHLLEAAALNRDLGRPAVLAHDLARAAAAEPVAAAGAAHARAALVIVEADPARIALAPEILARCALAFERALDAAAAGFCRRRGGAILTERLEAMDARDRSFYAALPWHRVLMGETPPLAAGLAVTSR
jgi:DNA-binding SARP family transcriptional activator